MSALTLELRAPLPQRVDLRSVTPDALTGLAPNDVHALPLWLGNARVALGELFSVSGEIGDEIRIVGDGERLDFVGASMRSGRLVVEGRVGAYAGLGMRGGELRVRGDAGACAGAQLVRGKITVDGNAGDFLGGALPGERQGMRGGVIVVRGNAGARAGDRQRRGLIVVEGDAGDYCGSRMVAGTIAVLGQAGCGTAVGMRRGTLLLSQSPSSLPVTFNDNGLRSLPFVPLLMSELSRWSAAVAALGTRADTVHRYLGDRANGGLGEVLVLLNKT